MINKERNIRFNITISKKQYAWLKEFSEKKHLTISKLIAWLLAKKTKDVISTLNLNNNPQEEIEKVERESEDDYLMKMSDEEFKEWMKKEFEAMKK